MTLIMHRCTQCGHPDYWARVNVSDQAKKPCPCGCACAPGPSETAPTWDEHGRPVERIAVPGSKLAGEGATKGGFAIVTCGCKACKALYAQLTTIAGAAMADKPSNQTGRVPAAVTDSYLATHN